MMSLCSKEWYDSQHSCNRYIELCLLVSIQIVKAEVHEVFFGLDITCSNHDELSDKSSTQALNQGELTLHTYTHT